MHAAGLAAVEAAKARGTWEAMPEVEALEVPEDLGAAVEAARARKAFEAAAPSYRRNVLRWIALAKRPETRAKRVAEAAQAAQEGRRLPQM